MQRKHRSIFLAIAAGKFTYLLVSMGLLLVLSPFLSGILWAQLATDIIFSLLFFSAIYAVKRRQRLFVVEAALAVLVVLLRWWYHFTLDSMIAVLATASGTIFFVLIAISIIVFVFEAETVTGDIISGSVCAYLLVGLAWAHIFALLEGLNPETLKNLHLIQQGTGDLEPFIYFSFVTMTTLGYGDIVPGTPPAHSLAAFEALTGQLYLTVLVARLVGLYGRPRLIPGDTN
jgi:voltage-gated potassium channel